MKELKSEISINANFLPIFTPENLREAYMQKLAESVLLLHHIQTSLAQNIICVEDCLKLIQLGQLKASLPVCN